MKLIILTCAMVLWCSFAYSHPSTGKKELQKCSLKKHQKKSSKALNCETVCCSIYQNDIQYNNALLGFQLDNCTNNSTTASGYDSCVDSIFASYQATATAIFINYSLCMYYSGIPY